MMGVTIDLVLTDPTASRHHCVIDVGPSVLRVRDLGSTNGTRLGRHYIEVARLVEDAMLTLGTTCIRCEISRAGGPFIVLDCALPDLPTTAKQRMVDHWERSYFEALLRQAGGSITRAARAWIATTCASACSAPRDPAATGCRLNGSLTETLSRNRPDTASPTS